MDTQSTTTINGKFQIRPATEADFPTIFQIWLEGIDNSFDTSSLDLDSIKASLKTNFDNRTEVLNFWVAVDFDDNILGWQSLIKGSAHPLKENYFAESSTYVSTKHRNTKGVGFYLFEHMNKMADQSHLKYLFAYAATSNLIAIKIIKRLGYQEIGTLESSPKDKLKEDKLLLYRILK